MTISQQQYWQARAASSRAALDQNRPQKIHVTSTLRDRTPVAQEKPLDEGQVIWGEPSDFQWGDRADVKETGPYTNTNWGVYWPDYGLNPTEDPDDTTDEKEDPGAITYEYKEVARTEKTVRVTGSNGAWVDNKVMTIVTFSGPKSPDGREVFYRFNFAKG